MVKVKIEVNGEEKKTCKGEAVYAVVMTEYGCQLIMVSEPEQGFFMIHLLQALVALVNNTIEIHAHGNPLIANRMHMEFAKEMRDFHLKHEKQDVEENVENMAKAIAHILSNLKEER